MSNEEKSEEVLRDLLYELAKGLKAHDYWYSMSDDHRVWQAGSNDEKRLRRLAEECGPLGIWLKDTYYKAMKKDE